MLTKRDLQLIGQVIEEKLKPTDEKVGHLDEKVGHLDEKVTGIDQNVKGLDERLVKLEKTKHKFVGQDIEYIIGIK